MKDKQSDFSASKTPAGTILDAAEDAADLLEAAERISMPAPLLRKSSSGASSRPRGETAMMRVPDGPFDNDLVIVAGAVAGGEVVSLGPNAFDLSVGPRYSCTGIISASACGQSRLVANSTTVQSDATRFTEITWIA